MNKFHANKTAIVVVDPFNDFLSEGGKLWQFTRETVDKINLVKNLQRLLTVARRRGILVVYAPHHHSEKSSYANWKFTAPSHAGARDTMSFEKGSWGAEFHPLLTPAQDDLIAQHHWTASGFANTDLDFILRAHDIDRIVVTGMRANTCIDSTARYGVELGYHVTLIKDCIGAFSMEEVRVTVEITFPNYGHEILTADEFINRMLTDL